MAQGKNPGVARQSPTGFGRQDTATRGMTSDAETFRLESQPVPRHRVEPESQLVQQKPGDLRIPAWPAVDRAGTL